MTRLERLRPEAFATLAPEWTELVEVAGVRHPFATHGWLAAWLAAFGGNDHEVVTLRRHGRLEAGWIARRRDDGALVPLEDHTYWPGVVHRAPDGLAALLAALHEAGLRRVELQASDGDGARALLEDAAGARFVVIPRESWPLRRVELGPSLDGTLARLDGKVARELRRKLRRFEQRHPGCSLGVFGRAEAAEAAAALAHVEQASWKAGAGTAITSSPAARAFYDGVLALEARGIEPRCYVVQVGGAPCAFLLGLCHGDAFFALKTSYRAEFASDSPGLVVLCRALEHLGREGRATRVELLGRDSRWKQEVSTASSSERLYELRARTLSARLHAVLRAHVVPLRARLLQARTRS